MKKIFTLFILLYCAHAFAQRKGQTALPALARIAYVNIDSLEDQYTYLREKREQFSAQQEKMEGQLKSDYEQMQNEANAVEARAHADSLTQTDYEAAEKRLAGMQKAMEDKKQAFTDQLTKDQDEVNADVKGRLDRFLAEYNKTHHYDCILSYSNTGSSILFISKELDITNDVIAGMNKLAEKGK
jgi:outer membrane protein